MKSIKRLMTRNRENGYGRRIKNVSVISVLLVLLAMVTSSVQGAVPPPAPAAPAAADAIWDIQIVDSSPSFRFMTDRSLAFRHDNIPCVVYGGDHLYYACWDTVNNQWQSEVVDADLLVGAYAALAFDTNSRPFISYYDAANGNLKMAYNLGGGWVKLVVDTNPVTTAMSPLLESEPVISPELQALHELIESLPWIDPKTNSIQQSEVAEVVEDAGGVGKYTSIAIDGAGGVHISYYDEDNRDLKYAYWNGLTWLIEVVDAYDDQGGVGTYTSIAADMYMRPHIAYMSEKYDDLKYARKRGNDWTLWTVDGDNNVGTFASLALQEVGDVVYPHISYLDFTNYNLKYAYVGTDNQWHKVSPDTTGVVGLYTSIARDADGRVWISYYDYTNGNLKYARLSGSTWTVKNIYTEGNLGLNTSIAIDKTNLPGIVFGDATHNTLYYTHLTDGVWVASDLGVGSVSDVGLHTSLDLNWFGEPIISYRDVVANELKYARYRSPEWDVEFIIPPMETGQHSSIKYIGDYQPAIAFYDQEEGDLIYGEWNLVTKSWDFQAVDTVNDVGQYVSLAIDSNGNPHMSYLDATYGNLMYAYWNTTLQTWSTTPVDAASDVGYFTSLALDESDRPYISYYDKTNEQIKYAFKTIITWVSFPLEKVGLDGDGVIVEEAYTSIALFDAEPLNPTNYWNMRIAFYDDTVKDVRFAFALNNAPTLPADWNIATLEGVDDVGKYVSLAIEKGTDLRHLCYYDETNRDLRYAYWDGIAWNFEIVDSAGDVGMYCSLALNGEGDPAISYYDAFLGNLKYASAFDMPLARLYLPYLVK